MKRFCSLCLLLICLFVVVSSSPAEVFYRRRGKTTTVQFANFVVTTGLITSGATFTLTCGCIAEGGSGGTLSLGSCNAGTTVTEIGSTGVYNLTINSADLSSDYCFIKAVAGTVTGSIDHLFEIRTIDYSYRVSPLLRR